MDLTFLRRLEKLGVAALANEQTEMHTTPHHMQKSSVSGILSSQHTAARACTRCRQRDAEPDGTAARRRLHSQYSAPPPPNTAVHTRAASFATAVVVLRRCCLPLSLPMCSRAVESGFKLSQTGG